MSRGTRHLKRLKELRMAKRDLTTPILDLDGKDFQPEPLTLGKVCFSAAAATLQQDANIAVDKKLKLFGLSKKAHAGGVQEFSAEEIALLKERIALVFSTIVMGISFELLEQDWVNPYDNVALQNLAPAPAAAE